GAGTTAEAHEATPKVGKPAPGTETAKAVTPPAGEAEKRGIVARSMAMVRDNIPTGTDIKQTLTKPVRYAEDGFSWVMRKFER
ncbi:hypothetical protein LXM94_07415, partial [Rhizobium sp. TRM95111]|nr:hypothetical protein [Rhizobium alarense]